jgi:hypothetical protein
MITIDDFDYEPHLTKVAELATSTIGLSAGDLQLHAAIVPKIARGVGSSAYCARQRLKPLFLLGWRQL